MSPRITILAFGTHGDVAPLTGLATALRERLGARVAVAAQRPYEEMINSAGPEFRLLPRDTESDTRASTYGQAMVDGRRLKPSKEALAGMRDDLAGVGEAMAVASADADLILCGGPVGSMLGWHVAEAVGVPSAGLLLQPAFPTGDFAPPPLGVRSYGRIGNRIAWTMSNVGEKLFTPLIDDLRGNLGLPHRSRRDYQRDRQESWTQICGYSERVVSRPRDWPDHVHITGYWWPAESADYPPPSELRDFLGDGPAPVYVGLGSTATTDGERVSGIVREALRATGHRGVVHRGWARLDGGDDPDVLTIGDIPHQWLLPRMAAAVHHCGAGTTAAALRAGIPSVGLPGIMDQPFWAKRLNELGCAPTPIPRTEVSVENLSAALDEALATTTRTASAAMAEALAAENGAENACRVVESLLEGSSLAR